MKLPDLKTCSIAALTAICETDWKNVNFGAVPYIEALRSMTSIRDAVGQDSGVSVVLYFLNNAKTWRGPVAQQVKAELRSRCPKYK
jgi:hypothetical protein